MIMTPLCNTPLVLKLEGQQNTYQASLSISPNALTLQPCKENNCQQQFNVMSPQQQE